MYSTLGKMPYQYCIDTERTYELFDEKGRIKKYKKIDYVPLEERLADKRPDLNPKQQQDACQLIRSMMEYDVKKRLSANSCLNLDIFQMDDDKALLEELGIKASQLDIMADDL